MLKPLWLMICILGITLPAWAHEAPTHQGSRSNPWIFQQGAVERPWGRVPTQRYGQKNCCKQGYNAPAQGTGNSQPGYGYIYPGAYPLGAGGYGVYGGDMLYPWWAAYPGAGYGWSDPASPFVGWPYGGYPGGPPGFGSPGVGW
jgi:hypothetical protein